ncbi:NYN domain-containing protein [Pleurocapsales cyanobacterium LEGE 10410]|nr:NYN domain-containing protein [Pleurocapsales cyanobacterium LEGE 10410]
MSSSPQYLSPLSPTGVILLDVENFPLKLDLGQALKPYCRHPITLKFAVANWQNSSIAKLDKYLHSTGYQLIHVPKEKNAADAQILTLGASLQLNYPQVKDIVIVSGDSIFNYLHQTLQRQGCNTYKVYQQSGNVYIDDFISDRASIITKVFAPLQQTTEHKLRTKIELTLGGLMQKQQQKVTLSQLSQEFKLKHNKSISEVLKNHKLPKSTLGFIKKSCAGKIDIEQRNNIHYLTLKSFQK